MALKKKRSLEEKLPKHLERNKSVEGNPKKQLSNIMDYNRPFSMFYSGVEYRRYFDGCYNEGVQNFLMSFEYLESKGAKDMAYYHELGVKLFIDSGAFTYISNTDYRDMSIDYWEAHIERYLAWAERHQDIIFAIANLDLEQLVGTEQVWEWNKKYFEPFMLRTGIPVCFVWHEESGMEHYEKMCQRYPYVGFSMVHGTADIQRCIELLAIAEDNDTLVHGMGMTSIDMLTKLPFYTVDSSVDGKSSIVIKYKGMVERLNIEDFYKRYERYAEQTTPTEMRIPMALLPHQVLSVNDNLESEWRFLSAIVKHTVKKKTVKICTEGGKDIICTTDHSIIGVDKFGNITEIKADELNVGNYVLGVKSYEHNQPDMPNVILEIPKTKRPKEKEEIVVDITPEFLEFLGLWVGDGCYFSNDGTVGFSCYQDAECKQVIDTVAKQFNLKVSPSPNGVDVRIHSIALMRIMKELGFDGKSDTKRIPKFVYSLSDTQICHFLRGYFSADGTGTCECSTVSFELKNDLVQLLEMFGMYVSVSYKQAHTFMKDGKEYQAKQSWHLCIRDIQSKQIFRTKIGFLQSYKNFVLDECISQPVRLGAKRNGIPKELAITDTFVDRQGKTKWVKHNKGRISREYEGLFSDKVRCSDLTFLRITKIEPVNDDAEVEVYDLSVCGTERFIANGILVHNTTWKAGLRYGMYVTWTGTSVKQFPKDAWEEKVLPYFKKYNRQFDMEKLFEYDEPEVIKASVYAFQCAEKYLREILEPLTYWQKPRTTIQKVDKGLFPPPQWFEDAVYLDLEEYAKQLNINPEIRRVIDYVVDCTVFCWWEDEDYAVLKKVIIDQYADGEEGFIAESYDKYLNKISFDTEGMLHELREFFEECVRGTNDKLLLLETPYTRVRKERKFYVDSADNDEVELSAEQVVDAVKNNGLIAEGELEFEKELDDEIHKNLGILVKRGEHGKIISGNANRPKPKSLIGNTPKIMCDNCIERNACPEFKRGYVCAYDKIFNKFDTRNPQDVADAMYGLANVSVSRLQRALVQENLDGGMISSTVSTLIDQNLRILTDLKKLEQNGTLEVLRKKTVFKPDGTVEEEQSLENPQAGGILAQLFAQNSKPRPDVTKADEIERPEVEDITDNAKPEKED